MRKYASNMALKELAVLATSKPAITTIAPPTTTNCAPMRSSSQPATSPPTRKESENEVASDENFARLRANSLASEL